MTRAFKISFPVPGRRPQSRSPNPTPGSQYSSHYSDLDDSLLSHPSPKVQEVLGASTPDSNVSSKRWTGKERTNARKPSGYMSVVLADYGESESAREDGGYPYSAVQTPETLHPNDANQPTRPLYGMNRHGSSPLLGDHPPIRSTTSQADYFSVDHNNQWPRPRQVSSLSALRSHYEKPPLAETYQNSGLIPPDASNPRGESQIIRSRTTPRHIPIRTHSRTQSGTSKESNRSNSSAQMKIDGFPRRRPSVTDPPTLYPNTPKAFAHAVSPPPALINSSLPKSIQPGQAPALSFGKPRWWDRKRPKTSPIIEQEEKFDHGPLEDGIASAKVNVRRPKKGITNWFDAVDTDESSLSHYSDAETGDDQPRSEAMQQQTESEHPMSIEEIMALSPPRSAPIGTSRKSSFNNKSKRNGQSERKLSFKLDSSPPHQRRARDSTQTKSTRSSFIKSAPGSPTGRNSRVMISPRGIPMKDADLQFQSVLNLTSSSDEEETEGESSAPESSYRGHRIRASIERAEYSDEVHLGNALRVQPIKPKAVVNRQSDRSSYRRSPNSPGIPPVPQIPSHPVLTKRNSSMRWRAMLGDKGGDLQAQSLNNTSAAVDQSESTVDSAGESSQNGNTPPPSQGSVQRHGSKRSGSSTPLRRGSKLMSVTSEEETLLEAMREKRASIRATDFQKGFNSAMQLHVADYLNRPKTSGADGRTSRSSIYGAGSSRGSISPPLLGPTVYRPTSGQFQLPAQHHQEGHSRTPSLVGHLYHASLGAQSGLSASTDNLTLEDAYPFPEVPSEPIPLAITRTSVCRSEASPSLTYSTSDMLPSTPSTFNSPMTPPSEPVPALPSFSFSSSSSHRGSLMLGAYGIMKGGMGHLSLPAKGDQQQPQQTQQQPQQQLEVKPAITASGKTGPGQYGHERRETGSSSVVVLDGVESYAAKLDEENEISGWAFDSGMDRW